VARQRLAHPHLSDGALLQMLRLPFAGSERPPLLDDDALLAPYLAGDDLLSALCVTGLEHVVPLAKPLAKALVTKPLSARCLESSRREGSASRGAHAGAGRPALQDAEGSILWGGVVDARHEQGGGVRGDGGRSCGVCIGSVCRKMEDGGGGEEEELLSSGGEEEELLEECLSSAPSPRCAYIYIYMYIHIYLYLYLSLYLYILTRLYILTHTRKSVRSCSESSSAHSSTCSISPRLLAAHSNSKRAYSAVGIYGKMLP
jgi:hypothetical protein